MSNLTELRHFTSSGKKNKSTPDFFIIKQLANELLKTGRFADAEKYYFEALKIKPSSDIICVNLATLYVQLKKYSSALEFYRKAIYLNTLNADAWLGLALVHNHYGDLDLGWANLKRSLDINGHNEVALKLFVDWSIKYALITGMISYFTSYDTDFSKFHIALSYYLLKQYEKSDFCLTEIMQSKYMSQEKNKLRELLNKEL